MEDSLKSLRKMKFAGNLNVNLLSGVLRKRYYEKYAKLDSFKIKVVVIQPASLSWHFILEIC